MTRKFWDSVWGRALSTVVLLAAGFAFFEWMDYRRDRRSLEERVEADKRFRDSLRVSNIKVSGKRSESETVAETEPETVDDSKTTVESQDLTTEDQQQTDATEPEQITDEKEGYMLSGPYAGMTLKEAQAAARKNRDWHLRDEALQKRANELRKRRRAIADAMVANGQEELKLLYAALARLPTEQLEAERQRLLETHSEAEVDKIFQGIAQNKNRKSPEDIEQGHERILQTRETNQQLLHELNREEEEVQRERKELERISPFK